MAKDNLSFLVSFFERKKVATMNNSRFRGGGARNGGGKRGDYGRSTFSKGMIQGGGEGGIGRKVQEKKSQAKGRGRSAS